MAIEIVQQMAVDQDGERSDRDIVRDRMLDIVEGRVKATPTARIQAARVLLEVGQENPAAREQVTSLWDALRDADATLAATAGATGADAIRRDTLLRAMRQSPDGIGRADARDLLECSDRTAYTVFISLRDAGLASRVGRGSASRWVAVEGVADRPG